MMSNCSINRSTRQHPNERPLRRKFRIQRGDFSENLLNGLKRNEESVPPKDHAEREGGVINVHLMKWKRLQPTKAPWGLDHLGLLMGFTCAELLTARIPSSFMGLWDCPSSWKLWKDRNGQFNQMSKDDTHIVLKVAGVRCMPISDPKDIRSFPFIINTIWKLG